MKRGEDRSASMSMSTQLLNDERTIDTNAERCYSAIALMPDADVERLFYCLAIVLMSIERPLPLTITFLIHNNHPLALLFVTIDIVLPH